MSASVKIPLGSLPVTLEEDSLLQEQLSKRHVSNKEAPCRRVESPTLPLKKNGLPLLELPRKPSPPSSPAHYSSPHHPPPFPTHTSEEFVVIDIGGEKFCARRSLFLAFPSTRLGKLMAASEVSAVLELCEEFTPGSRPEFFFDRSPETFGGILEMYRSGSFHLPEGSRNCAFVLQRDIEYWGAG